MFSSTDNQYNRGCCIATLDSNFVKDFGNMREFTTSLFATMKTMSHSSLKRFTHATLLALAVLGLSGCEQILGQLGIEDPNKKIASKEAEGKAVGGGCRHSGRAIEDCYSVYTWLPKDAVFTGWREMDAYMRENNIETIAPQLPPPPPPPDPKKKKKKKGEGEEAKDGHAPKDEKPGEPAPPAPAEPPPPKH